VNEVSVDAAALAAEAAALELPADLGAAGAPGGAEDAAAPAAAPSVETIAAEFEPGVGMVIASVADGVLPNWRLTLDEKKQLAHAAALALAHWFPDATIPPKYLSLVVVAYVGYQIVEARRDPATGELAPRKIIRTKRPGSPPAASSAPGAPSGDGFRTSA